MVGISQVTLIFIGVVLFAIGLAFHDKLFAVIKAYFTGTAHPINLAVFRIVLFAYLLNSYAASWHVPYGQFASVVNLPPLGSAWLFNHVPLTPSWITSAEYAYRLFICLALVGLFTRVSCLMTCLLGFYLIGLTQLFGKVSHVHHLIWFPAILAFSRAGDALSVDALVHAWKRAGSGRIEPPQASVAYALPFRFIWLLMGVIYFFPGFWKWWSIGFRWVMSDNLKFHMYGKWLQFGDWTPFFRLDHYPALYRPAALATIAFEMGFIFLLLFPRLRIMAAVSGLMFHNLTNVFMRISFFSLQICYAAYVNWYEVFNYIGRITFNRTMIVVYDGNCKLCRRAMGMSKVFDILNRITYVNAFETQALAEHGLESIDEAALMKDMHAFVGDRSYKGYDAYRAMICRMPLLWFMLPPMYAWPVPRMGRAVYRKVADTRTCALPTASVPGKSRGARSRPIALICMGVFLLAPNILLGVAGNISGWPFSCYPTFAYRSGDTMTYIKLSARTSFGEPVSAEALGAILGLPAYRMHVVGKVLMKMDDQERIKCLDSLVQLLEQEHSVTDIRTFEIHRETSITIPERRNENPLSRELVYVRHVTGDAGLPR